MKCHKCNHISFDHLSECRKCGVDLSETRAALGFTSFSPDVPFLLGLLLSSDEKTVRETAVPEPEKAAPEEFSIIEMGDSFDLPGDDEPQVPLASGGQAKVAGGSPESRDPADPAIVLDDEISIPAIDLSDEDGFDLSLSFDEEDDIFESAELGLPDEREISSTVGGPEKDRLKLTDGDSLVLEDSADELTFDFLEPPAPKKDKAGRTDRKKPARAQKREAAVEEENLAGGDLTGSAASPDAAALDNVLEFELEEIDFDALSLDTEESPESHERPSAGRTAAAKDSLEKNTAAKGSKGNRGA